MAEDKVLWRCDTCVHWKDGECRLEKCEPEDRWLEPGEWEVNE
jgi:hypothetical protein